MLKYIFLLFPVLLQAQTEKDSAPYRDSLPLSYFLDKIVIDEDALPTPSLVSKCCATLEVGDTMYYDPTSDTTAFHSLRPDWWSNYVDTVGIDTVGWFELEEHLYFTKDSSLYYTIISDGIMAQVVKTKPALSIGLVDNVLYNVDKYIRFRLPEPVWSFYIVVVDDQGQKDSITINKEGDLIISTEGQEIILKNTRLAKNILKYYPFR